MTAPVVLYMCSQHSISLRKKCCDLAEATGVVEFADTKAAVETEIALETECNPAK